MIYHPDYIIDENQSDSEGKKIHAFPYDDLRLHVLSKECWCHPEYDDDYDTYTHKSMDGREDYETGKRKPH